MRQDGPPSRAERFRSFLAACLYVPALAGILMHAALAAARPGWLETPSLARSVAEGFLPPVTDRLPAQPLTVDLSGDGLAPGRHGGELRTLISNPRDVRYMTVYGYARLIGRNRELELVPDILAGVDNFEDRVFTLHLRPGHKWSDGAPFTSEDFRYFWEDVAMNPELSPNGPGPEFLAGGGLPEVEFPDAVTVRYSWRKPHPDFLEMQGRARPLFLYLPSHYLRQFHARYADPQALAAAVAGARAQNWKVLHTRLDDMYQSDNPALPSLQPWIPTRTLPGNSYVFQRNPYYHRVDRNGRQLPYIDRVIMNLADSRLIPAKSNAGESDLQAKGLSFSDLTVLKQGEERSGYRTLLWPISAGSQIALYPNLNYAQPGFRDLLRNVRFRRALSLGIDRHLINRLLYFGLGEEANNTVLPQSEFYERRFALEWAMYDPVQAGQLLDGIGLTGRDANGIRQLPDGAPLQIIVETSDATRETGDVLQLIAADWRRIGIDLRIRHSQRESLRANVYAGRAMMSVWTGLDTGIPDANMSPDELAPLAQDQLQWPFWGQYFQTGGEAGEAPDLDPARELLSLAGEWRQAPAARRREIWRRMLEIHAGQLFTIGVISGVRQPVVVSRRLRNVPEEAFYGWSPGALFGVYRPDQFWLEAPVAGGAARP